LLRDLQFKPENSRRLHKFLSKVAVLPILLTAQGTSAADTIFARTEVENYFVLAAVVGSFYQFLERKFCQWSYAISAISSRSLKI
jgi:hypothetical protein